MKTEMRRLQSVNVCSRANQTATSAQPLEQHVQTQQWLRADLLKDSAPFSGGKKGQGRETFLPVGTFNTVRFQ